ncbi:helix-turn-helix domain-containing protein [Mobilitalea sibirica]|uniref:Helix-turn-helix domain-containing protein n=1 Tax=Mobilitalea sibirica TaxID=1462919 RepID=A0A8J7KVB7_9FIRM|nr:helix-turn-helix domain-containing protein [Mobilitalea sibirica]MBH1939970.1 helix-turn-helix domain-containing protein [Mobilitalea sibirica]
MNDLNQILLNPIRMRIIQHLATHKTITAGELISVMDDVPRTTLYRHINTLVKSGILTVVSENKIRGTVENVYALNINVLSSENTLENATRNAFGFLMKIYADFDRYFSTKDADPQKDRVFLNNSVLLLSDDEYDDFLKELKQLIIKYMNKEASNLRRSRSFSVISSPSDE